MSTVNDFWRYVHEPSFMQYVNPNKIAPLHNNITHEWPGMLTVRMNPISGAISPCSGDVSCFGNWYDGPIIPTSNINIGPLEPPLSPEGSAIEPVDYKTAGSASMPPSTPQGNPLPITSGQVTSGCTACQGSYVSEPQPPANGGGNGDIKANCNAIVLGRPDLSCIKSKIGAWLKSKPGQASG